MNGGGEAGKTLELALWVGPEPAREKAAEGAAGPRSREDADSDEALVRQVARGSASAFETVLERYRDRVFQFVLWQLDGGARGGGRDLAEELTQEIFFQVYRSASSFGHRSRFRTWLYSLARNVCRHHERKHRGESGFLRLEDGAGSAPAVADGRPDALARLATAEEEVRVRRAVAALPAGQRAALVLRDWEGLSYEEIARVLRVPVGTVRSRLHHARGALAAVLAAGEEERRELS